MAAWSPGTFVWISLVGLTAELLIAASTLLPHAPVLPVVHDLAEMPIELADPAYEIGGLGRRVVRAA